MMPCLVGGQGLTLAADRFVEGLSRDSGAEERCHDGRGQTCPVHAAPRQGRRARIGTECADRGYE